MTQAQALDLLREIRGLERLEASITRMQKRAPEWRYGLVALDDRLRWCRYCLSREDPLLVASVEELLTTESLTAEPKPSKPAPPAELPPGGRVY